ncbi:MAG: hypothetical protein AMJ43_01225 [Coxiella sp. DG_40]|nr:MAG: hypothetical protein AMJ43_01225 [Coxiella sp. DG_40]
MFNYQLIFLRPSFAIPAKVEFNDAGNKRVCSYVLWIPRLSRGKTKKVTVDDKRIADDETVTS